jgi:hypothetical protein
MSPIRESIGDASSNRAALLRYLKVRFLLTARNKSERVAERVVRERFNRLFAGS